jgi:RNA polymerase sigma factor (sigma-70 family)
VDEAPRQKPSGTVPRRQIFPTTHWTTLLSPIQQRSVDAEAALERLCQIYRGPLVACAKYLLNEYQSEAEDVVHDFICTLLRRNDLLKVQRESGKFRSYLAAGLRHQAINYIHARRAQKRGGGAQTDSLEEVTIEPAVASTAESALARKWIEASINEVLLLMEQEWTLANKLEEFNDLKEFALSKKGGAPRGELAAKYRISLNAVDAKVSRFRRRFRELLRELIGQTVKQPDEVDEEIRYLMGALGP